MILTGQNFSSDSKVVFMEKTQGEWPGAEGTNVISAQFGFCSVILHDANENAAAQLPFGLHFRSGLHDVPHIESLSLTSQVVLRGFDNGNFFFTFMNMIKPVWKRKKNKIQVKPAVVLLSLVRVSSSDRARLSRTLSCAASRTSHQEASASERESNLRITSFA